ncbi:MAG: methylglyoxal synthase [Devosia sp.]
MARIGLVAHDDKKAELVAWALKHKAKLGKHELWGTGTTGGRIVEGTGLQVTRLLSGPLGGDAQIGAMIAEGRLEVLIFFQDPLTALPHDVDVKALTRLATLYNIPLAMNHATADAVLAAI